MCHMGRQTKGHKEKEVVTVEAHSDVKRKTERGYRWCQQKAFSYGNAKTSCVKGYGWSQ